MKKTRTFQRLLKDSPSVFKDYKIMKNTDLHIKILPPKMRKLVLEIKYSKTCVKRPLSKRPKIGFKDQLSLNAGQKYCRMLQGSILQGSILQYFQPSLCYHLSLRSLFCPFLSGRFTQVLLYKSYALIWCSIFCTKSRQNNFILI